MGCFETFAGEGEEGGVQICLRRVYEGVHSDLLLLPFGLAGPQFFCTGLEVVDNGLGVRGNSDADAVEVPDPGRAQQVLVAFRQGTKRRR